VSQPEALPISRPPSRPRAIAARTPGRRIAFSIATLVNDRAEYEAMVVSFRAGGFDGDDCEYLFVDNTAANTLDGYTGLARLLDEADGTYVILCHQDVRLIKDGRAALEARLADLEARSPDWALAGNAGGIAPGRLAARISDPHAPDQHPIPLPARVHSLDENFIVVRRAARISPSRDLAGFHFYGTDLCLQAELAGWSAHVIDFHLRHLSPGHRSAAFFAAQDAIRLKYARALRPRWVQTTCALLPIAGSDWLSVLGSWVAAHYARIARRLPRATGWTRHGRSQAARSPRF
jgi:hypothetical protein